MLADARNVLADTNAGQELVDSTYQSLLNAIFGLREIPDKSKLEELIQQAEKINVEKYSEASVQAFNLALEEAKNVFENSEADKEAIKIAEKNLRKAIKDLQVKNSEEEQKE